MTGGNSGNWAVNCASPDPKLTGTPPTFTPAPKHGGQPPAVLPKTLISKGASGAKPPHLLSGFSSSQPNPPLIENRGPVSPGDSGKVSTPDAVNVVPVVWCPVSGSWALTTMEPLVTVKNCSAAFASDGPASNRINRMLRRGPPHANGMRATYPCHRLPA